ncbi:hypothetical protein [Pigmentiphaga daeguensis]
MKTIEEIRLERLRDLVSEAGSVANLNRIAKRNERDATISQILNRWEGKTGKPKELGSAMARALEEAMGKEVGWMDNDPATGGAAWPFPDIDPARFSALPERLRGRAEERVLEIIKEWEASIKSGAAA